MRVPGPLVPALTALFIATSPHAPTATASELCAPVPGLAVVEGRVIDFITTIPLQSADVVIRWPQTDREDHWQEKEVETDREGRFRVCDAPHGRRVLVQARFMGEQSESRNASADTLQPATVVLEVQAPHSTLGGRVFDHDTNHPVADAAVRIAGQAAPQITRDDGSFRFDRVPPGVYTIDVQHIAYLPLHDSIDVRPNSSMMAMIHVAPHVIPIAPIEVTVRSFVLERVGFYQRQQRHIGTYITRSQIEARPPMRTSDLLRAIAGVRLAEGRMGALALGRGNCPFRYILDGTRIGPGFSIDDVPFQTIEGLEVYLGPSQVPVEFNSFGSEENGTCGAILIWTRNRT